MTYQIKCQKCKKEIKNAFGYKRWKPYCVKCFDDIVKDQKLKRKEEEYRQKNKEKRKK